MKNCLIYCHQASVKKKDVSTESLEKGLKSAFSSCEFQCVYNLKNFQIRLEEEAVDLIILDWGSHPFAPEVVEMVCLSPASVAPLLILYQELSEHEKVLLREYRIGIVCRIANRGAKADQNLIINLIKKLVAGEDPAVRKSLMALNLNKYLINGNEAKARACYSALVDNMKINEKKYYEARFSMLHKKHQEAVTILARLEDKSPLVYHLLGSLYFELKKYDTALEYLEQANSVSPLNLQRHYLIYRCHLALSQVSKVHRQSAMRSLIKIYSLSPNYQGTTQKLLDLTIASESVRNLETVKSFLMQASRREIASLMKKIGDVKDPFRSVFIPELTKALSLKANEMIKSDDITALKYYKYIAKLIPDNDLKRRMSLEYCVARAYFRFGQLEIAKETNDRVLKMSDGEFEKSCKLDILIEKAMQGDFDVLLDDEEEWLK